MRLGQFFWVISTSCQVDERPSTAAAATVDRASDRRRFQLKDFYSKVFNLRLISDKGPARKLVTIELSSS